MGNDLNRDILRKGLVKPAPASSGLKLEGNVVGSFVVVDDEDGIAIHSVDRWGKVSPV